MPIFKYIESTRGVYGVNFDVVDTTKICRFSDKPEVVCGCFDEENAKMIEAALNLTFESCKQS